MSRVFPDDVTYTYYSHRVSYIKMTHHVIKLCDFFFLLLGHSMTKMTRNLPVSAISLMLGPLTRGKAGYRSPLIHLWTELIVAIPLGAETVHGIMPNWDMCILCYVISVRILIYKANNKILFVSPSRATLKNPSDPKYYILNPRKLLFLFVLFSWDERFEYEMATAF